MEVVSNIAPEHGELPPLLLEEVEEGDFGPVPPLESVVGLVRSGVVSFLDDDEVALESSGAPLDCW